MMWSWRYRRPQCV